MKTIKYILVLLLFWANTSCADFLDRYPQDSVTNETYWKTEEQLRAALYPCYEAFEYELMMFHNFTKPRLDNVLKAMREKNLQVPICKAVVTTFNRFWSIARVCHALEKEHLAMQKQDA